MSAIPRVALFLVTVLLTNCFIDVCSMPYREKRFADQRLAHILTELSLAILDGMIRRTQYAHGIVNVSEIGKRAYEYNDGSRQNSQYISELQEIEQQLRQWLNGLNEYA